MTRIHVHAIALVVLATLAVTPAALAQTPRHTPRAHRAVSAERSRDFQMQQQQIRRARGVTRRVLRDRRASPEMKQQASDLDAQLDRRAELLEGLEARHKAFVTNHQAEFDELEELRQRAREIDERLKAAREGVIQATEAEIAALKESSTRSIELVEALQEAYRKERRERRRR